MDFLTELWSLLAFNPLNITFTFNVEISTSPTEELPEQVQGADKMIMEIDSPNVSAYGEYFEEEEEGAYFGFDVSKIQGGKQ